MSRIAKKPIPVPAGVQVNLSGSSLSVKGAKGELSWSMPGNVKVVENDGTIVVSAADGSKPSRAMSGTARALISNMVVGVSDGFQRKLELVGVGYRAQAKGNVLSLSLGFSHPVDYEAPAGVTIETPSQTEILIKGVDKQRVGQVAAEIRAYSPPEPYKGKGVKYAGEQIVRKEAKKK